MTPSKTDRYLQILIGALLVVLVAVILHTMRDRVIEVGDPAPDFSVQTDGGVTMSPSDFGGRVLVLNFWATWCPPCIEEFPSLSAMQDRLKGEGVVVLGVSVDEDEAVYQRFLEQHSVSFSTARDPEARISADFGTFRYPETYIIDSGGQVVRKIIGPTVWTGDPMISYIRSLL